MTKLNPGARAYDPEDPVGRFRLIYQITAFTEMNIPDLDADNYAELSDPDTVNYVELSDKEIEAYLAAGGGNVNRGIGYYVLAQSSHAARQAKSVKDYDLAVDLRSLAKELDAAAQSWFNRADREDMVDGESDIFEVFGPEPEIIPEGTLGQVGREYTWTYF